jgi:hypothetical protein
MSCAEYPNHSRNASSVCCWLVFQDHGHRRYQFITRTALSEISASPRSASSLTSLAPASVDRPAVTDRLLRNLRDNFFHLVTP